jgi:hypothetical protein
MVHSKVEVTELYYAYPRVFLVCCLGTIVGQLHVYCERFFTEQNLAMIADDGRRWQTMADDGRRLQTMADDGRRWQTMADDGRRGQTMADDGRRGQTMADDGRRWQTMADDGRRLQTVADDRRRLQPIATTTLPVSYRTALIPKCCFSCQLPCSCYDL